jgi:hypothetical protein
MSELGNTGRKKSLGPSIPRGHTVGEFSNYQEASAMVTRLVQGDFPAAKISIVGHDPVIVENIRSKLGYGRIAMSGALAGFWLGLIFALLLGIGFTTSPDGEVSYQPQTFAAALIVAAGIGMLINILRFAFVKSKRTYLSTQMPVASRYVVIVPADEAALANKALSAGASE